MLAKEAEIKARERADIERKLNSLKNEMLVTLACMFAFLTPSFPYSPQVGNQLVDQAKKQKVPSQ